MKKLHKLYKDIIEWCLSFKSGGQVPKEVTLKLTRAKDELVYPNIKLPDIDDPIPRWKLIDPDNMTMQYVGERPYQCTISSFQFSYNAPTTTPDEIQYNKGFKAGQRYEAMERFNNPEDN